MEANSKSGILKNFLNKPFWDTKTRSASVKGREMWLAYVLGPYGALLLQSIVNSYYNQYLTDVLGFTVEKGLWIAGFMVAFPVISKIIDAVTNLIMSGLLDRTESRQGKLRPWLILSLPVMIGSVLLLFWIPVASPVAQAVWVVIAYNLYYSVAYTMWNMPTQLAAPLSTRNVKQRSHLSMAFTITRNIGTGLVSILFPTLLSAVVRMAAGDNAHGYFLCMAIICGVAIPLLFIQYFFMRERITEENRLTNRSTSVTEKKDGSGLTLWQQFKIAIKDRYWLVFMLVLIIMELMTNLRNMSLVYYTGWVVKGNAYGEFASIQAKFQMIAMSPMGPGLIILLPLLKKLGRRKVIWMGSILTIVGSTLAFFMKGNSTMIYAGSALAAFGNLAFSYTVITYLGDVIDHVEWKTGKRVEGISGGVTGAMFCMAVGIAQGIFNLGLMITKYAVPKVVGESAEGILFYADQTAASTNWINIAYQGSFIMVGIMFLLVFLLFFDLDNHLPKMQKDLEDRKIEKCKELGIEYVPASVQEQLEKEEQERIAEEARVKDLEDLCRRKGLNFEEENRKYLEKKAKKDAKKAAKAEKQKNATF